MEGENHNIFILWGEALTIAVPAETILIRRTVIDNMSVP